MCLWLLVCFIHNSIFNSFQTSQQSDIPLLFQSLEHRLHSANHSLQATPNSTIHSLVHQVHPPLVDLWNTGQMEAYQAEAGGYMGVAAVVEPSLCVSSGDNMGGTEHSPLLEQQEEEEVKVRWTSCLITENHILGFKNIYIYIVTQHFL